MHVLSAEGLEFGFLFRCVSFSHFLLVIIVMDIA